jgi:CMP-N,N'-diacetyllegionaminic acid synthase
VTPSLVALVPARAGSERVPGKNVRPLAGHPLLAYAVATGLQAGADRVVCSTDSEEIAEIARWYGADVPFLRPAEYATATSPDLEWLAHLLGGLPERYDLFALLRPTSPFRGPDAVRRGLDRLLGLPGVDSVRAVEPVKQHPGKTWVLEGDTMRPFVDQSHLDVPWHDSQYQALPPVYVQTSALEIAWTRVVGQGSLGGQVRAPLFTEGHEGLSIDREEDWERAESLVASGAAVLPRIDVAPFAR